MLHKLLERYAHQDATSASPLQIKVLARSEDKAARLREKYPSPVMQTLVGDMSDLDKVEAASRESDLVINTSPDITHDDGIKAILRGLEARGAANPTTKPYYIHTSGASLIWDEPTGNPEARLWDDIADITELCSLNEKYTHAVTDKIVRDAGVAATPGQDVNVNVSIVSPGFVGGMSPSLEHPTPITTPAILTTARAFNSGFQIAQGQNSSAWIHVSDLADIFLLLVNDALAVLAGKSSPFSTDFPLWGPEAYYFGVTENIPFCDFIQALAPVLKEKGVIKDDKIESVSVKDAARISLAGPGGEYDPDSPPPPVDSWAMHIAIMYGVNMRLKPSRVEKMGWKPKMGRMVDTFPEVVSEFLRREKLAA